MPEVPSEASPGAVVELVPMTDEEYVAYDARARGEYAQQVVDSGQLTPAAAAERAAEQFAELLPDGSATSDMHLWTATVDGAPIGLGWLHVRRRPDGVSAWVYDIQVDASRRGEGLGRALMLALQAAARDLGASEIGLNVFGHNTAAIRLYESLGYAVTAQQMKRAL